MKDYIEKRAVEIANYIINEVATVRQTARIYGASKSTVHKIHRKWKGIKTFISPFLSSKKLSNINSLTPPLCKGRLGVSI